MSGQRLYREAIERENIKGGGFSFYVWRGRFEVGKKGGGKVSGEKGNIDSIQSFQGGPGVEKEKKEKSIDAFSFLIRSGPLAQSIGRESNLPRRNEFETHTIRTSKGTCKGMLMILLMD